MQIFLESIGPILKLFAFLAVLFIFLGLMMSSPYTRRTPDCSVWCVLEYEAKTFIGMDAGEAPWLIK
ncbi:MAG: hypothetical protein HOL85_21785 [Rhodospirillaceae bacterium]|jgi:hypothetical protein|nr:hypothetical protein [Rhodospirillaceae bacterium]MBT6136272.1 hypothetical protein [Rhodospirillaceae bacterium]